MAKANELPHSKQASTPSPRHSASKATTALLPTSGTRPASSILSVADAETLARKIDFRSITAAVKSLNEFEIDENKTERLMVHVYGRSPSHSLKFAKATIRRSIANEDAPNHQQLRSLIQCGCGRAADQAAIRSIVCTAFRQSKLTIVLVHAIAELKKSEARAYMKSLLSSPSELQSVLQWLELVGRILRHQVIRSETDKKDVDIVTDTLTGLMEDSIDVAGDLVTTIVDAVKSTGRVTVDIIQETVNWPVKRITHLVSSLVEAGESIDSILRAAKKLDLTSLKSYVGAICSVSRSVTEIVQWAGRQTVDTIVAICTDIPESLIQEYLKGVMRAGASALKILKAALRASVSTLAVALTALLNLWGGHRQLTEDERKDARRVFGWSIDLDRVKVAVASIPADVLIWLNGSRPFTTMYVINFASWQKVTRGTLIHELTHVWQGVIDGPVYMVEALHSQVFGRGYSVTDEDLAYADGNLANLEREQQAVVVERYWQGRYNKNKRWKWTKYEKLARQVYRSKPTRRRPHRSERLPRYYSGRFPPGRWDVAVP